MSSEGTGKETEKAGSGPTRVAACAFVCGMISYVFFYILLFAELMRNLDNSLAFLTFTAGWVCAVTGGVAGVAYFHHSRPLRIRYAGIEDRKPVAESLWPFRLFIGGLVITFLLFLPSAQAFFVFFYPWKGGGLVSEHRFDPWIAVWSVLTFFTVASACFSITFAISAEWQLGHRRTYDHMALIGILAGAMTVLSIGFAMLSG